MRRAERVPLILLPGTLCDAELWTHQTRYLADIAIPAVGDLTRDETIAAMAERTLRTAPPRFVLAGLSMGAIVAFEIMRRAPERVVALALLNTNPTMPDKSQVVVWQEEIDLVHSGLFAEIIDDRWLPALIKSSGSRGASLRDVIRGMAYRVGPRSYVRQLRAQIGRPDSWLSLAAITCPTLVLAGRQDTICALAQHEAIADIIARARLSVIEDCGHLSAIEQPEIVTALLRGWLEEVTERQPAGALSPEECRA